MPIAVLEICFVHPDYRRRGVGKLLMAWGLEKADEMGLECYIDATSEGVPLYETFGFLKGSKIDFIPPNGSNNTEWQQLKQELTPFSFWPMWRPVKGLSRDDESAPWE